MYELNIRELIDRDLTAPQVALDLNLNIAKFGLVHERTVTALP